MVICASFSSSKDGGVFWLKIEACFILSLHLVEGRLSFNKVIILSIIES